MITTKNADNALKTFYLDAVSKAIDTRTNPFLAQIERTSVGVSGKEVRKLVRYGLNGAVGVGTETGNLPTARGNQYLQYVSTLKNIYGTIEISDKALRVSQSNEGALVNLLNEEMEGLVDSAKYQFGRMLYGNGNGMLAEVNDQAKDGVYVTDTAALMEGMAVKIVVGGVDAWVSEDMLITKVEREQKKVYFDAELDFESVPAGATIVAAGEGEEITGLKKLFDSEELYGIKKEEYPFLQPYDHEYDEDFSEELLAKAIDGIEERSGGQVNIILCSWGMRRTIEFYFKEMGTPLATIDLGNGFKALEYRGVPIVADRFCQSGTIYLLNTNDFKLCQLCDWEWMESEDGAILRQVPGKPVFTATLVKYAELICERPHGQGRLSGIYER